MALSKITNGGIGAIDTLVASGYVHGGAGTIVQTRATYIQQLNSLNTTSFAEFSTAFRLSITPEYSNSIMVVEYATALNPDGAANLLMLIKPIKIVSGQAYDLSVVGSANGSSNQMGGGGGFRSNNGYDTNDQNIITFMGYDIPGTTSTMQYGFQYKCEGSQTTRINHSSSSNSTWGYTLPTIIRATEIKA